ncbi:MAG: polysaccharide biosynthesis C-terminal domain-containing protein [Actinomycetota bacterium]|nr:polysaccharide biosynthesis C-terminal domain-containing protein [Actinomycetota bacterium]
MARQFGWLTAGRATAAVFSFLWLAIAARSLSLGEFADLALILAVGAILSIVADGGLALVLNEAVAADPARGRSTLVLVIRWRMLLAVGAAMAMAGLYMFAANDASPAIPAVFAVSMLSTAWHTSCAAALRGAVSVVPDATNEMLSRLLVLAVGGTLVSQGGGVLAAVAVYAGADTLSAVALTIAAWRLLAAEKPVDRSRFRLVRLLPLGLASVVGITYYRLDVWLLAVVSSASEVARYSVTYRILDVLILPAGALAVVTIAATALFDDASAVRKADRMAGLLCACAVPAVIVLEAIPGPLLRLAFGALYVPGVPVLRVLGLAVIPSVAVLVWGPIVALRHRGVLAVTVASLALNVALNLVLIPHLGAMGAAIATVFGQTAYAVALRLRLREPAARGGQEARSVIAPPAHALAGPV